MRFLGRLAFGVSSFLLLLLLPEGAAAQREVNVKSFAQLNSIFSVGEYAPFWLAANRHALSSVQTINGYARYGAELDGAMNKKGSWRFALGLDVSATYNQDRVFPPNQLYADISWRWLTVSAGIKQRSAEMRGFAAIDTDALQGKECIEVFPNLYAAQFSELGTGGLMFSGNSAAIPQLRVEVPEYVSIPGTKNWLKMRGHIAYGAFLDSDFQEAFTESNLNAKYAKNILYHSKAAFIEIGNTKHFPLTMEGGLEMYSMFGGDFYTRKRGHYLSMPRGVKDYFKAFIPLSGDETTPAGEQANISGNQTGNWHLAFTLHTKPIDIRIYGEHLFEDFSQLFFFEYQSNRAGERKVVFYPWRDMQVGISIKNKSGFLNFISNVQYEYMSTYDQSGAGYNDPSDYYSEQMDGVDDYYNHSIYTGWHYYGMGVGNPLVYSPVYNKNANLLFQGNRLKSHHVGINGAWGKKHRFMYRLMYTYSENWGTYYNPYPERKYTTSAVVDVAYVPYKGNWVFSLSLGYDKSNLIGENVGAMISVARVDVF